MKKQLRCALMAVLFAGISGCGLKGPLYFPPDNKPATPPIVTNSAKVESNSGTQPSP